MVHNSCPTSVDPSGIMDGVNFEHWACGLIATLPVTHWRMPDFNDPPDVQPLSSSERLRLAGKMGLPPSEMNKIARTLCFTLPEHPLCLQYQNWYIEQPSNGQQVHGIIIENFEQWQLRFGYGNTLALLLSLLTDGKPIVHWMLIHDVRQNGEEEL